MNKALILMLTLLVCSSNIECKSKKINKASEFLKGTIALTAAAGLAYLAYEAPIGKIQNQWTRLKNAVVTTDNMQHFSDVCSNHIESVFNSIKTSAPWTSKTDNKSKLFSLVTIIPAWELFKYSLDKLGNSVRAEKISCKQKD